MKRISLTNKYCELDIEIQQKDLIKITSRSNNKNGSYILLQKIEAIALHQAIGTTIAEIEKRGEYVRTNNDTASCWQRCDMESGV